MNSDSEIKRIIHDIEIDAGYYAEEIQTGDELVIIFLFEEAANNVRIMSREWDIFFGQQWNLRHFLR